MQKEKDKWKEAIAIILDLTQKGVILWQSAKPNEMPKLPSEEEADSGFLTLFKGKSLRIYKRWHYTYPFFESKTAPLLRNFRIPKPGDRAWTSEVVLEMVNEYGDSLWTFPRDSMLNDLIKAIKYQVSGVKEFIDELLSNE